MVHVGVNNNLVDITGGYQDFTKAISSRSKGAPSSWHRIRSARILVTEYKSDDTAEKAKEMELKKTLGTYTG